MLIRKMKIIFLSACLLLFYKFSNGQDSIHTGTGQGISKDSIIKNLNAHLKPQVLEKRSKRNPDFYKDTVRRERRKFDSTLFTNVDVPSTSDYAEDINKVYQNLTDIPGETEQFKRLDQIQNNLDNEDSLLEIIKDRIARAEHGSSIRSLQMLNTLLDALDRNTETYSYYLDKYDSALDDVKVEIADFRRDSLMLKIFRDTSLMSAYKPQLLQIKTKWREVDSLVTENGKKINTLKSETSAHDITIGELLGYIDVKIKSVELFALHKEQPYLWESGNSNEFSEQNVSNSIESEIQFTNFYFANTKDNRGWLLIIGLVFFLWIWVNFRTLKKLKKEDALQYINIKFISPTPVAASLLFVLSLVPFIDFHAPAIYMEIIQILLLIVTSFCLRKQISKELFYGWGIFLVLFVMLSLARLLVLSVTAQRWITLIISIISVSFGAYYLWRRKSGNTQGLRLVIGLYVLFNLVSLLCNLLSRVTLAQIFSQTSVYAFSQAISLYIFVSIFKESFLLQVQTSRIRKNYPLVFDSSTISKSLHFFATIVAVILWLIVFTINIDLFDTITDILVSFFTKVRIVGSFSFTIGGIVLFLGIIGLANFLQKYIAYFFGDTGDDAAIDDKGQRSRLMVTRLILLIAGFLLAVAASGFAVDRITVILGALGVGVGLGLQNIVNNFVSGVILIFDRPLRIGDTVDIGDKRGRVKEIGIRSSTLLTEEGAEVIIPNGDVLSQHVVNWTLSNNYARSVISFTITKPENRDQVNPSVIKSVLIGNPNLLSQREPEVIINTISNKEQEIKIIFWIKDFNKEDSTVAEIKNALYDFFEKNGILTK